MNVGGLGTGFYVTDDIVLTNHHVIDGTQFVELKLNSGEGTFGRVIASDPRLDLAIVRVQARGAQVTFYSEATLTAGAAVEAIGHPRGLYFSITKGVVSGLHTAANKPGPPVRYLQTDVAMNPGNSGGPLFYGEQVVGVNTWGLPYTKGFNFAVHYAEVFEFLARNQVTPRR